MTSQWARWPALALAAIALMLARGAVAQAPPAPAETGATAPPAAETGAAPAPMSPPPQASPASPAPEPAPPVGPGAWQTVTGPERSFTAELPAAPKYSATEMKTGTGSLYTVHQYLLEQGDVAYIVQAATYPEDINVSNPRTNLQGGLDNLAKSMEGAKWASVDWVSHQGLTATDAVGARSGHAIRSFSVMKGRQVFTLIYAGAPGTARSPDVNRFVGSLRVGP
jgi:hypothetical protein